MERIEKKIPHSGTSSAETEKSIVKLVIKKKKADN